MLRWACGKLFQISPSETKIGIVRERGKKLSLIFTIIISKVFLQRHSNLKYFKINLLN